MLKIRVNRVLSIIIVLSIVISVLGLGYNLHKEKRYTDNINEINKLTIKGTYNLNGSNEVFDIPSNGEFRLKGYNSIVIKGNFSRDVPMNTQIIMRIDNLDMRIFVNEKELYYFGNKHKSLESAKSSGNLWTSIVSPGIKSTDNIRIELFNEYKDHVNTTFSSFINNIYVGYESNVILGSLNKKMLNSFLSVFIVCIGVSSIGFALILRKIKLAVLKLICFGGLCISSGVWSFLDFNLQNYIFPYPVFNNSLDIVSLLFSMSFIVAYFGLYLSEWRKTVLYILSGSFSITIIVTTALQVLGVADYYQCLFYVQSACLIYTPIIVGCVSYESIKKKSMETRKLLLSTIIIGIGIMGDAICNMFEIIPYMIWFKVSYFIFIVIQFTYITDVIRSAILESTRVDVLEELAYHDTLTGLGNRTAYLKKINQIDKKQKAIIGVFDINYLKVINDTLGHEYGDDLIIRSANILLNVFDNNGVYRIGGDEFVAIKENLDMDREEIITRLHSEVAFSNKVNSSKPAVEIAWGVSEYNPEIHPSYQYICNEADKEMYKNKAIMKSKN